MVGSAIAGSIKLRWDKVYGASGYTLYYGTQSGSYDHTVQVGNVDRAELTGLPDCADLFVAVKARNATSESAQFSNEVSGWSRPLIRSYTPRTITQGQQRVLELSGLNFQLGATIEVQFADAPPTDIDGKPLFRVDSASVIACDRIQALVSAEPGARGLRAAPIGPLGLRFGVRNPDTVLGRSALTEVEILLDEARRDINRSDAATRDRVDGSDLTWLAYAFGSGEGDAHYLADADLDGNGEVDGVDLAFLASVFGYCRSGSSWSPDACS